MNLSENVKVWFTCPESHADRVREAIGDADLGVIGNYSHCSFVTKGVGYSKPNAAANPHIGEVDEVTAIPEVAIDVFQLLDF